MEDERSVAVDLARPTFPHLPRDEFCERAICCDHGVPPQEQKYTLFAANNYAATLRDLKRFEEARSLLRRTMPVARRVHGTSDELTLRMRKIFAEALYMDTCATFDDLREAVAMLEETERIARRVLGGAHPLTTYIEASLQGAQAALRARETPPARSV